jgi:hypothetical protein
MASFLPFRPCFRVALGSSAPRGPHPNQGTGFSSLVLHRHPGVSPSDQPSRYRGDARGHPSFAEHLAEASSPFSVYRKRSPLLSPRRWTWRPEAVSLTSGGSALRVWLPSQRLALSLPREPLGSQRS